MSGSIEQQISHTAKPETNSLADSVGDWLSHAAQSVGSAAHNVEASAVSLASSVHLPNLQLVDSGSHAPAPAKEAAPKGQGNHQSLLTEAENVGKNALDAIEHHPVQAAETAAAVVAAALNPAVSAPEIIGAVVAAHPNLVPESENVATQLGKGALDEVEHHPLQLVETAAVGLAAGAAIGAAAVAAVGAGIISVPVAVAVGAVAAVGAVGYGAYEAYEHRDAIIHDTEAVANPNLYSAQDVAQARQSVQNFGGEALVQTVGIVSSVAGGFIGGALVAGASDAAATAVPDVAAKISDAPTIDLDNPSANTNAPALAKALQNAIQAAKASGQPTTFTIDNTVPLTDASGAPIDTTQAKVIYQELQTAYPENHFVFSKPDLNPGDPGYTESPAIPVTQDGLHISSKENPITLATGTTLPDGTTLPAGSKFVVGTTYDGSVVKSPLPGGKVWAIKPDGSYVQVAGEGQSTAIPSYKLSTDPKLTGQVVNARNSEGVPNNILVRSDAKAVDPDGRPLLDAYPVTDDTLSGGYKPGTQPGTYAALPKSAAHFGLPSNITVVTKMGSNDVTASGANGYYFMQSGYGDAPEATATNYSGPTNDPQSAAEIARLRAAQGLDTPPA